MKLADLKKQIIELEARGVTDEFELKAFDDVQRLRDFDVSLELGGIDSKDKYSNVGRPCVVISGVRV